MEMDIYTVHDIAKMLKVSEKTVYRLVKDGEINVIRIYGSIRIPRIALEDYLRQHSY